MRRLMGVGLVIVLALGMSGCNKTQDLEQRVAALEQKTADMETHQSALHDWAALMTVDNDPTTDPGSAQDSAYVMVQTNAICKLLTRVEQIHNLDPDDRLPELVALCGPVDPVDPVFPPKYPPAT